MVCARRALGVWERGIRPQLQREYAEGFHRRVGCCSSINRALSHARGLGLGRSRPAGHLREPETWNRSCPGKPGGGGGEEGWMAWCLEGQTDPTGRNRIFGGWERGEHTEGARVRKITRNTRVSSWDLSSGR